METASLLDKCKKDFYITYSVDSCFKWLGFSNPVSITFNEFCDILVNNGEIFDDSNNKPTQSTSFSVKLV